MAVSAADWLMLPVEPSVCVLIVVSMEVQVLTISP